MTIQTDPRKQRNKQEQESNAQIARVRRALNGRRILGLSMTQELNLISCIFQRPTIGFLISPKTRNYGSFTFEPKEWDYLLAILNKSPPWLKVSHSSSSAALSILRHYLLDIPIKSRQCLNLVVETRLVSILLNYPLYQSSQF